MKLLAALLYLSQAVPNFSDAQCHHFSTNFICQGIDQDKFLHEFYSEFHEGHLDMNNSINISGGNWITIEYFPELPTVFGNYAINKLAIRNASVQHIHDDAFKHHQSLKSLDLSWNKLEDIEFVKYLPTSLESLNLAGNNIVHIENVFERLSLQHIDMSYNNISIPDFHPLWNSLDLSHNKITQFNETMLGPSKSLNLSYNNLSVVEIVYDKDYLNLSNNNISRFIIENNQGSGPLHCEEIHLSLPEHDFMMRHYDGLRVIHKVKLQGELNLVSNLLPIILEKNYGSVDIHIDISYSTTTDNSRYQFKNIYATVFNMSHINAKELRNDTFSDSRLAILDLSHSNIEVLHHKVFKGLASHSIDLSFNKISNVNNVFYKLDVEVIDLSFNVLKVITNNSFEDCGILLKIILSNCFIERVEPSAFMNLVLLEVLDLRNNRMFILETDTFHDIPIRELKLEGNEINTIRTRAFNNLYNILSLNLSHVNLQNLETKAFFNMSQIKSVDLSYNVLRIIPPHIFKYTSELKIVNFTNNNISTLNQFSNELKISDLLFSFNGTFSPTRISNININNLILVNSTIDTLKANSFERLYNLKKLHFTNSNIHFVEVGALNDLFNLNYLDSRNLFRNIQHIRRGTFRDLRSLKKLDLSGLSVQTIESNSFEGLYNLQMMRLSGNVIKELENDTFTHLSSLKKLDLSFNQITNCNDNIFSVLENLKQLFLQHNNIPKVGSNIFKGLPILEILRLDFNNISALDHDSFSGLNNLRELHLDINSLSSLPLGVFQYLPNLMMLNLSYNKFESFETGVFSNLVGIRVLDLRNTYLTKMEEVGLFFSMRNLRRLYLDRNNLKQFNFRRLLTNLKNIRYMGISHNKWQCKDLSVMIENLNNKSINYNPAVPAFDNDNIDGIGCIDICDYLYCSHTYDQPNE